MCSFWVAQSSQEEEEDKEVFLFCFVFGLKDYRARTFSLHFYCRVSIYLSVCRFGCAFVQFLEPTISRLRPHTHPTSPSTSAAAPAAQTFCSPLLIDKSYSDFVFLSSCETFVRDSVAVSTSIDSMLYKNPNEPPVHPTPPAGKNKTKNNFSSFFSFFFFTLANVPYTWPVRKAQKEFHK